MDKNKFVLSLLVAVVGLLMLVSPEAFIAMVVIIVGVAAIVDGAFIMVTTRNLILDPQYKRMMTIRGVLSIVAGSVAILIPLVVAAVAWKIMAYVLAVYLLISALIEGYGISVLHRNGIMVKQSVIEALVSVILAVVLMIIPAKKAGNFIVGFFGFILLAAGLITLFFQWRNRPLIVTAATVSDEPLDEEQTETEESEASSEETAGENE